MASGDEIVVVNGGSSSVKLAVFSDTRRVWSGEISNIGAGARFRRSDRPTGEANVAAPDQASALTVLMEAAANQLSQKTPLAVGHRVVHGGADFRMPVVIDEGVAKRLNQLAVLAPLHMPQNLAAIAAARAAWPSSPQIAAFDTMFHATLPARAARMALPHELLDPNLRRYGFHGLSFESILAALAAAGVDVAAERIVIAHLGAGASACAVKDGRSIETTMGFSTLSGLPMNTRCGDLDPGALLYLLLERGLKPEALQHMLYERSGLAALAQGDMKELLSRRATDPDARFAVEYFCYQARRHMGALIASLGGLDRLVFTGGIGTNAAPVRAEICAGLDFLGVDIDVVRNVAGERRISAQAARVLVEVIPTDEEGVIAAYVRSLISA